MRRFILTDFKSDLEHGLFIIIDAHFSIIFIVFLVLKQSDPLLIGVKPTIQDYELRDGNTADIFFEASPFADESDVLI